MDDKVQKQRGENVNHAPVDRERDAVRACGAVSALGDHLGHDLQRRLWDGTDSLLVVSEVVLDKGLGWVRLTRSYPRPAPRRVSVGRPWPEDHNDVVHLAGRRELEEQQSIEWRIFWMQCVEAQLDGNSLCGSLISTP